MQCRRGFVQVKEEKGDYTNGSTLGIFERKRHGKVYRWTLESGIEGLKRVVCRSRQNMITAGVL